MEKKQGWMKYKPLPKLPDMEYDEQKDLDLVESGRVETRDFIGNGWN